VTAVTVIRPVFAVARWTLTEAIRRRMVLVASLLSVVFVALFATGFILLYTNLEQRAAATPTDVSTGPGLLAVAVALTLLGLYAVQFLAALLALFLGVGSLSSDIDSGALHAVLARPLSRGQYLFGRFFAFAFLLTVYCVAMFGALLLVAWLVAGYQPLSPVRAIVLVVLEMMVLLAVGTLGSTRLSTLANGVLMFSLFGLAWLAGIVGFIGDVARNDTMINLGTGVSLLFPSDTLWRGASYYAQPRSFLALTQNTEVGSIPFASKAPIASTMLIWALCYLVVCLLFAFVAFGRRDL
jgi:Cu-processing system permease protein